MRRTEASYRSLSEGFGAPTSPGGQSSTRTFHRRPDPRNLDRPLRIRTFARGRTGSRLCKRSQIERGDRTKPVRTIDETDVPHATTNARTNSTSLDGALTALSWPRKRVSPVPMAKPVGIAVFPFWSRRIIRSAEVDIQRQSEVTAMLCLGEQGEAAVGRAPERLS